MKKLKLPVENKDILARHKAGEEILLNGTIYTARDKVHDLATRKNKWPFALKNNGIFYTGPTPPKGEFVFGSCGPTTSSRMDPYTPGLYSQGLAVTVGKGARSRKVSRAISKYGGLYLVAYGGCGALYGARITSARLIGYPDLGPQAVYRLTVKNFPVVVGIDNRGDNLFNT
ncbi:MAG: fumarate hydratase C-terminal domain-containing protein [Elusimicrobiota bacterium]